MGNHAITVGPIALQDFEVPTSIHYGGHQRLAVHRTADGTRHVERLGPDDAEICFQGIFSGNNAQTRARALNGLRIAGTAVWLSWQSFRYKVIVADFSAAYHSQWWIAYSLRCVVVHQSGVVSPAAPGPQTLILGALASLADLVLGPNIAIAALSSAMTFGNAFVPGSTANASAIAATTYSLSAIQSEIDLLSQTLINSIQAPNTASSFNDQVACSASLASAANAKSYVRLICTNLGGF